MGGERKGLTDEQMAQCDHLVRIPMAPTATADSLNLAMATSILLYELFTQKGVG
jgi:TrmH family RNA methyltransferase